MVTRTAHAFQVVRSQTASVDAAVGGALALAQRPDYTRLFGRIRFPTLGYVRLNDVYPIEITRTIHQKISNSKPEIIPDAAHAAILRRRIARPT